MTHTQTPWKIGTPNFGTKKIFIGAEHDVTPILQVEHTRGIESKANAEFIVRAVNAHDELVLAAKDACIHIRELAETLNADYRNNSTFKRLLDAIAKAEGK